MNSRTNHDTVPCDTSADGDRILIYLTFPRPFFQTSRLVAGASHCEEAPLKGRAAAAMRTFALAVGKGALNADLR